MAETFLTGEIRQSAGRRVSVERERAEPRLQPVVAHRHERCAVFLRTARPISGLAAMYLGEIDMAPESNAAPPQFDRPFRLFAAGSRVLAQNAAGKLIDLGEIVCLVDGGCQIKLDVDGIDSGPQAVADAALRALVPMLTFDYLDGLFTSEADAKFHGLLEPLPHTAFTLPETVPRELVDRRPPERF